MRWNKGNEEFRVKLCGNFFRHKTDRIQAFSGLSIGFTSNLRNFDLICYAPRSDIRIKSYDCFKSDLKQFREKRVSNFFLWWIDSDGWHDKDEQEKNDK